MPPTIMVTVGMLPLPELLALLELQAETPASRIVVAVAASAIAGFLRNMGVLLVNGEGLPCGGSRS
jgi:hypothetical protein